MQKHPIQKKGKFRTLKKIHPSTHLGADPQMIPRNDEKPSPNHAYPPKKKGWSPKMTPNELMGWVYFRVRNVHFSIERFVQGSSFSKSHFQPHLGKYVHAAVLRENKAKFIYGEKTQFRKNEPSWMCATTLQRLCEFICLATASFGRKNWLIRL